MNPKRIALDEELRGLVKGRAAEVFQSINADGEVEALQECANHVAIKRLGYNDHGPIHMRITTLNALRILNLLSEAGSHPSIVAEQIGTFEDAQVVVVLAGLLHDVGMGVTRSKHEWHSVVMAKEIVQRHLAPVYGKDKRKMAMISCMIAEAIIGHMGEEKIHSVEAGAVLVGDGTDMTRGRSRIAKSLSERPTVGDIHRHSADAITSAKIVKGIERPIQVEVTMDDYSGVFQVEAVLMPKIVASPIRRHVEVGVTVAGHDQRVYRD